MAGRAAAALRRDRKIWRQITQCRKEFGQFRIVTYPALLLKTTFGGPKHALSTGKSPKQLTQRNLKMLKIRSGTVEESQQQNWADQGALHLIIPLSNEAKRRAQYERQRTIQKTQQQKPLTLAVGKCGG